MLHAVTLSPLPLRTDPFDHISSESYLSPEVCAELERSFPECAPSSGPTGFSYYWGDAVYDKLIANNWAWKCFFDTFHNQRFVDYCLAQFAATFQAQGCVIDLQKARYVPYRETRPGKELRHLREPDYAPHDLFVRLDVHQGHVGYFRRTHLDHRRRLATLLIYFSDSDETGREGGDLVLHRTHLRVFRPAAAHIRPRRNLMAGFACSPVSYHSVPPIESHARPRNFVQIQLSSTVDDWVR